MINFLAKFVGDNMQTETINTDIQQQIIADYWIMLRELESQAENDNSKMLKLTVEHCYNNWNKMTGSSMLPIWKTEGK